MKDQWLEGKDSLENINEVKVDRILTKIESVAGDVKRQVQKSKTVAKTLKKITNELKSLSCSRTPKFTEEEGYVVGKTRLSKLNKDNVNKRLVDGLLQIIDEKQHETENLITEETMKNKVICKALKARKREFGFKKNTGNKAEAEDPDVYVKVMDRRKTKMLSKILYNQPFRRSFKGRNTLPTNEVPQARYRHSEKLTPISLSPSVLRQQSPTLEDFDMKRFYQQAIKKSENESACDKVKLSRLLSLRNVFKLVS